MKEKVLVTGASGFIASHLIPRLVEQGYDVTAMLRYVTGRRIKVKQDFGDVRDAFQMREVIKRTMPDRVIHLAAISPVSYSYEHPQEVSEVNYIGTINLAEACLRYAPNLKQFVFACTSEIYGNQPVFPIKERVKMYPNSPYAVSKLAANHYLNYMYHSYDFPVTVLRPFNTFGRIHNKHFVTERIIWQMLMGDEVRLGDPEPIRDMMYVADHVDAYLKTIKNESAIGEVMNICTGRSTKISKLADMIADFTDFRGDIVWNTIPPRPLDIDKLVGSNSKAHHIMGWTPSTPLEWGLRKTIQQLREQIDKKN